MKMQVELFVNCSKANWKDRKKSIYIYIYIYRIAYIRMISNSALPGIFKNEKHEFNLSCDQCSFDYGYDIKGGFV